MRYMLRLYSAPQTRPDPGSQLPRWFAVTEEMGKAGVLVAGDALQDEDAATTLRDGTVTDGPFAEVAEHLGGYYEIEARDLDHAIEVAKLLPSELTEIRPIVEYEG